MGDVTMRHLAAMIGVVDEGSFARAADRLGFTQSTVSQQIATLERAVGGAVFDRPGGPRPVQITPLGRVVIEHGRELLAAAQKLDNAVERYHAGDGRIAIGTFQSVSNVILPAVVRRLRDEHPACEVTLSEEEPNRTDIGELDLLFHDGIINPDSAGAVEHIKLLDDPYLLVAAAGTYPDGPVPLAELHETPLVAWPLNCDQPWMEHAIEVHGVKPTIVFRSANNETLLSMVKAGMGSAVLPSLAVQGANIRFDRRLSVHELQPSLPPREIHLHWPATRTQSPLATEAIAIAIEVAAETNNQSEFPPNSKQTNQ